MLTTPSFQILLPHQCPLCLGHSAQQICSPCLQALPAIQSACHQCAMPLAQLSKHETRICGQCLQQPPPFRVTVCPLIYAPPVSSLIRQFKSRSPIASGHALIPVLLNTLQQTYNNDCWPEAMIPTPQHWLRRWRRGFNQAHYLAEILAQELALPVHSLLQQKRRKPAQKTLKRKARLAGLRDVFRLGDVQQPLPFRHVALVDDVITTGATASALAKLLLQHGAERVDVWALARTL